MTLRNIATAILVTSFALNAQTTAPTQLAETSQETQLDDIYLRANGLSHRLRVDTTDALALVERQELLEDFIKIASSVLGENRAYDIKDFGLVTTLENAKESFKGALWEGLPSEDKIGAESTLQLTALLGLYKADERSGISTWRHVSSKHFTTLIFLMRSLLQAEQDLQAGRVTVATHFQHYLNEAARIFQDENATQYWKDETFDANRAVIERAVEDMNRYGII